jgi:hypothetical protein
VTARQLALDCEPTWLDPEPDDDGQGPWCRQPGRGDLWGQGLYLRQTGGIHTVQLIGGYL